MTDTAPRKPSFKVGAIVQVKSGTQTVDTGYEIVDKDERTDLSEARELGRGAAGITYRAKYKGMDRAIKFLWPDANSLDPQAQLPFQDLFNRFQKEIRALIELTHTNICKLVDFGEAIIEGSSRAFYVMEYVEGDRFDRYCGKCSGREFILAFNQLLDALAFLHSRGWVHCDVKAQNVFVQTLSDERPHLVLLDLGGAKLIASGAAASGHQIDLSSENTVLISTESAQREAYRSLVGKLVKWEELRKWGADLDLGPVGHMLQRALEDRELEEKLRTELTEQGRNALGWIVDRLLEKDAERIPLAQRNYTTAGQLREDFARLGRNYMWPLGLPELSLTVGHFSVQLPDRRVGLTPELLEIVNHPLFLRLRRIRQLDYLDLVYAGGTHARFEHALHTFDMARLFLAKLLEDPAFRMLAKAEYVRATLLAALLHDIGHYPLAHVFEDFVVGDERVQDSDRALSDDELFRSFINPTQDDLFAREIQEFLDRLGVAKNLRDLITKWFGPEFPPLLCDLVYLPQGVRPPIPTMHGIINSAIDVDKLSYLSADSSATGVPFGKGIDIGGLVDSLVPPRRADQANATLAITENGLAAAESAVLARLWMYGRAYWHRTNRSIIAMHKFVIAHLVKVDSLSFRGYFARTLGSSHEEASALLAEWYRKAPGIASAASTPLDGIMGTRREVYRRLVTISKRREPDLYAKLTREARSFKEAALTTISVAEGVRKHLLAEFKDVFGVRELKYGDVIFDAPLKARNKLGRNVVVYPDRGDAPAEPLSKASSILESWGDDFEENVKKCRIFVHPDVEQRLQAEGCWRKAEESVRRYLGGTFGTGPYGA